MNNRILCDVLDTEGKITGKKLNLDTVHADGHWHATVHIWVYDQHKHVLLRRRDSDAAMYPGRSDISVDGHVYGGESPLQAAVRRTEEELNVIVPADYLHEVSVQKVKAGNPLYSAGHREHVYTYLLYLPHQTPFQLGDEDLGRLYWAGVSELLAAATDVAGESYVPHREAAYWREAAVWVQNAKVPKVKPLQRIPGRRHLGRIKYKVKALLAAA